MDDFAAMNEIYYGEWIDKNAGPTRACFESRLAVPKYKIEIIATAAV